MKDIETKHRFVELRAQGKSLRTVADELTVGLQTAVRWERELKEQIENLKAMELDALLEQHRLTVQAQIERYGLELARVTEELQKRDLASVQLTTLQRFRAGEIDEHAAITEIALVNSVLKGIGLTSVQEELQHIKDLLHASAGG